MRTAASAIGLGLLLAGCARDMTPEARGRAAFVSYDCKRCHRVGAEGGTTGPDLTYVGFRKNAAFLDLWLENPPAWQPDTLMPNFHLNPPTRRALAAYLGTLKGQAYAESGKPWKSGKDIFETVGCATCHGRAGKGGYRNNNVIGGQVPSLKNAAEGFTRAELVARISQGVPHSVKADPKDAEPLLYMPAWREVLSQDEIGAVADYVLSLKPKGSGESW